MLKLRVLRLPAYIAWPTIAAATYGVLYFFANRSIYFSTKYPEGLWDNQHVLEASDVWINSSDGVRLHAWFVAREGARWVTLFLHGNAGNITHRLPHIQEIVAAGSSILILDYRGYGKSGGRPTEQGLYLDSDAAYQYLLRTGYRADQIIIHGESLGTAVAIDLASRQPCAALILEAPFTSASDVAGTVIPILGPMLVHSYNSVPKIGRITAPKLFMQGDHDEVIPPRLAQALYATTPAPKEFWVVEAARHNDIVETAGPRYRQRLEEFYRKLATDAHG